MNNGFSIKKAKRVLGKVAKGISDEQLQKDIDTATLLKELFFDNLLNKKKKASQTSPNVP